MRAERGEFEKISLPKRVMNLPLPDVMTVDMRDPAQTKFGRGAITRPLHQAMVEGECDAQPAGLGGHRVAAEHGGDRRDVESQVRIEHARQAHAERALVVHAAAAGHLPERPQHPP